MVCRLGIRRMAAMARLLDNGDCSGLTTEEVGSATLAAQSIHREWCEADEANLLDEEDMHVFDCNPLVDPLHLVCCNKCKKPVKASQYAAHAERCDSLNCSEEILLELDGGTGYKKPPRKGKKKSQTARGNPPIAVGDHEVQFVSLARGDTVTPISVIDSQTGMTSFSGETKGNPSSIGAASANNGSVYCPRATCTTPVPSASEKRTKLIEADHMLISEGLEPQNGVTANSAVYHQKASTYPPVPLATKMYHSQRNLRLRFALNHLYHVSTQYNCSEIPRVVQDNVMLSSLVSSPKDLLHDPQLVEHPRNQVVSEDSEVWAGKSIEYTSEMDMSNQLRDAMRNSSGYISTPYSYTANSGTSLQQPTGSVHVL